MKRSALSALSSCLLAVPRWISHAGEDGSAPRPWQRPRRVRSAWRRWLAILHAALQRWSQPHLRCLAALSSPGGSRRQPILLGLEQLETRELLNASWGEIAPLALLGNDTTATSNTTVSAAASSQSANAVALPNAQTSAMTSFETMWNTAAQTVSSYWQSFLSQELALLAQSPIGQAIRWAENEYQRVLTEADDAIAAVLAALFPQPAAPSDQGANPSPPAAPANHTLTPGADPTINYVEGTLGVNQIMTFTDSDGNTDATKYTASINWGDGDTDSNATIMYMNGQFQVSAGHLYDEEGNYPISITINDTDSSQISGSDSAAVSDASLSAGMMSSPIQAYTNQAFNGTVVSFNDANSYASASDFSATINWGDGQSSPGTAVSNGSSFNVQGTHTYTTPGTYSISVNITDDGGSQLTVTNSANVTAAPLVVTNPGNQSNAESNSVSLQVQSSGGIGAISFGSSNLPSGLSIDSASGLISGTIAYTDAETQGGLYPVTVTAIDSTGTSSSASFNWTVTNTDTPPTLDNPGNQSNWQGDAVALQLSGSDPDGDNLTYSATGLPGGLTLNPATGLITGVLAAPDASSTPYNVTASVSDGTTSVSQSFTWTVTTVQIDPIADQTNLLGDSVSLATNAWDESGQPLSYSASGLPPGVSINSSTGLISGTIANTASVSTPYNVTVTAADSTDSASTSFTWNISSFTLDNPGDQTNAEGDAVVLQPTVETNGSPTLTFSATGLPNGLAINSNTGLIAGTVANLDSNNSPYSVTISATDGTSTSSQTFTWTITHVLLTDPGDQINAAGNTVSLQLQASDPDHDSLSYTATGLPPGLTINGATGLISGTIASTAGSETPYSVTITASDGTHTATDTFNWTVSNGNVQVTNPGTQSNAEGDTVSLPINASDSDGDGLSFTATGLPLGLQIDYASGVISGTIDGSAAETNGGVYTVTVLADDGQSDNGSTTFTWNVSHTNQAPTLDNPGDQVDQTGDVVSLPLSGSDDDGDTVTYTATGLPPGLTIDSNSGIISGTLPASAGASTPYSVTVTVSDGTLTTSQTFNWFVNKSVVTLTSPGDQTNTEGNTVSLQLSASDSNSSTLSYQASGLPSGLSFNTSTGLISGTIASGDAANGPYTVTVMAVDAQGNSASQQFLWTINPANLNPVLTSPGLQINAPGDVLAVPISATDPTGNGLTYTATGLPSGLSIDPSSGVISGVVSSSASGSSDSVTVTATDGSNSGNTTFSWTITTGTVTVTNPGMQNSGDGQTVSLQISASDSAQLPLTYTATGLPPGLSINSSTGLISGTIASSAGGPYIVTVMASDSQGNSGSTVFSWNVSYVINQAPTLDNPGDQTNHSGDVVSLQLSGSDVDGDTVTYSASGLPPGLSLNSTSGLISGTLPTTASSTTPYLVTVTASDGTLTASQTFNWFVTKSVVTLTNPGDQTNTEGNSISLQLSASDSNSSTLSYSVSGLPSGLSINSSSGLISGTVASGDAANGPYTVTVTASDSQGNSASQQFTWNVNSPANLTLTSPGNQKNAEGDTVSLPVQASDSDGDTLTYSASGLPIGLTIDPTTGLISGTVDYSAAEISGGQYNVTVIVNDGNGSTATALFVWTITDTDQGPWLDYPGLQSNNIGDSVSLQLIAGSPDGKTLTYSASGLPPGLSIDTSTGLISGTIANNASTTTPYSVTATVSDGIKSASQAFTWEIGDPHVLISFDGQPVGEDYLAEVTPATPVSALVTLEGATPGTHTITLNIPSNESKLSQSTFQLSNGGSQTVELTPEEESQAFDDDLLVAFVDGKEAGDGKGTNVEVKIAGKTIGGEINAKDTPAGMKPRIPPVKDQTAANPSPWTEVIVTITPTLKDAKVVVFDVSGGSGANGTADFLNTGGFRRSEVFAQTNSLLKIVGISQTAPSETDGKPDGKGTNAGNLFIVAYPGTQKNERINSVDTSKELAKSAGFSVAAIPINYSSKFKDTKNLPKGTMGIRTSDSWSADSGGNIATALDQVQISEVVSSAVVATGIFKDKEFKPITSGYEDADSFTTDSHFIDDRLVAAPGGTLMVLQLSMFKDARTGATDIAMPNSGYEITYRVFQKGGQWMVEVTKVGKKVTVTDPKSGKTLTSEAAATTPADGIKKLGGNG